MLYEKHQSGGKRKYAVTLNEALIFLNNSNGQTRICNAKPREKNPEKWVYENEESFSESFMVVGSLLHSVLFRYSEFQQKSK